MNLRHLLPLVSIFLLGLNAVHPASAQSTLNIEPPVSPEEEDDCEPCGCKNIGDSIHYGGSFHWKLNTGKARFLNTGTLLALSQLPSSKSTGRGNGGQPVERSVGNPLQQQVRRSYDPSGRTNVWLTIDSPDILSNPTIYTPSVLRITGSHATVIRDEE